MLFGKIILLKSGVLNRQCSLTGVVFLVPNIKQISYERITNHHC